MDNIFEGIVEVANFFASLTRQQNEAVITIVLGCLFLIMMIPNYHDILEYKRYSKRRIRELNNMEDPNDGEKEQIEMELSFRQLTALLLTSMIIMIIAAGIMYLTL